MSAWEQGQSLTLERNDTYFGPKAHLDSIVFRLVQQVKALPDVTSELNIGLTFEHLDFNFKNEHLAVRDRFANVGDNATQEGPFWNSGLWAQKAA